jgi:hypothetical protein
MPTTLPTNCTQQTAHNIMASSIGTFRHRSPAAFPTLQSGILDKAHPDAVLTKAAAREASAHRRKGRLILLTAANWNSIELFNAISWYKLLASMPWPEAAPSHRSVRHAVEHEVSDLLSAVQLRSEGPSGPLMQKRELPAPTRHQAQYFMPSQQTAKSGAGVPTAATTKPDTPVASCATQASGLCS